jgi:hypothetical protein
VCGKQLIATLRNKEVRMRDITHWEISRMRTSQRKVAMNCLNGV